MYVLTACINDGMLGCCGLMHPAVAIGGMIGCACLKHLVMGDVYGFAVLLDHGP